MVVGEAKSLRMLERVKGIEPSSSAWKAVALPLSYTRGTLIFLIFLRYGQCDTAFMCRLCAGQASHMFAIRSIASLWWTLGNKCP
jgi:hypothetical protein